MKEPPCEGCQWEHDFARFLGFKASWHLHWRSPLKYPITPLQPQSRLHLEGSDWDTFKRTPSEEASWPENLENVQTNLENVQTQAAICRFHMTVLSIFKQPTFLSLSSSEHSDVGSLSTHEKHTQKKGWFVT